MCQYVFHECLLECSVLTKQTLQVCYVIFRSHYHCKFLTEEYVKLFDLNICFSFASIIVVEEIQFETLLPCSSLSAAQPNTQFLSFYDFLTQCSYKFGEILNGGGFSQNHGLPQLTFSSQTPFELVKLN